VGAVVWFRRDLRLSDNPAWNAATAEHDEVLAVFVLDPQLIDTSGRYRRAQLLANLHALDEGLRGHGGSLRVRTGDPVEIVPEEAWGADAVYWNDDCTPHATRRDAAVRARVGCEVKTFWGSLVHPPGAAVTRGARVHRVFTPFYRAWSAAPWDSWPAPGDAKIADDPAEQVPPSAVEPPLPPGEAGADRRLTAFLQRVDRYSGQRDLPAVDGTSLLSADLKFGTISPREVVQVVGDATDGRRAFVRQLAWRDWYAHLLLELPELPIRSLRAEYDGIAWRNDAAEIAAWKEGRTGYPIVDAAMRQLNQTGWMHNRLRMIVGSFLVKDLLVDWRVGEHYFRHLLIDGDVAQNVGNWQWVAGTGPDAAPYFRVFNPITQSRRFDPGGEFVRRWLPELADLDPRLVHAPWEAGPLELAAAGVRLGPDYPEPIVDHAAARDRALSAYRQARAV